MSVGVSIAMHKQSDGGTKVQTKRSRILCIIKIKEMIFM